ncbi:MAG: alpha-N-acetylglucosaminidase N-terminal domain-containing protein, partial [Anaerohalosphaera sp.]|nr:alpha-N-acetylglucosaminidase N-terminal domain-containing protein [Anaerohalosphaera sp.]
MIITAICGANAAASPPDTTSSIQTARQTANNNHTDSPTQAAEALLKRLLPDHGNRFIFELIPSQNEKDVFEVVTHDNKVIIRGNNGVSMAMGLNWYLKYYCNCNVSWCGNNLNLPDKLPEVESKIRKVTWTNYRYFL